MAATAPPHGGATPQPLCISGFTDSDDDDGGYKRRLADLQWTDAQASLQTKTKVNSHLDVFPVSYNQVLPVGVDPPSGGAFLLA